MVEGVAITTTHHHARQSRIKCRFEVLSSKNTSPRPSEIGHEVLLLLLTVGILCSVGGDSLLSPIRHRRCLRAEARAGCRLETEDGGAKKGKGEG